VTLSELNDELIRIAGRNGDGQPHLRAVDGQRETPWMAGKQRIKYLDHITDDGTEVGQECVVVEIWRSPEFLAASGRFTEQRFDTDGSEIVRAMPSDGHYDYMLRVPWPDVANRAGEVLVTAQDIWAFQRLSLREQNALIDQHEQRVRTERAKRAREARNNLWGYNPDEWRWVATSAGRLRHEKKGREI
jgi:hypothetical protein